MLNGLLDPAIYITHRRPYNTVCMNKYQSLQLLAIFAAKIKERNLFTILSEA